ncbi:MAG TPA: glycosyltransferase family 39 protein [Gemmatimonadaceae bacterium]|nr:glycosyltransferase family 39 protein [Gemmatimonadaceae bacterium]HRQ78810.1 glycosyltransferase family 39 protein [Gemmatimonadaceae bacterium]
MTSSWVSLGASALLLFSAAALGDRTIRTLGATPRPAEGLLFSLVIGLGILGTLLLILSASGLVHPAVLWTAVALPALGGRPVAARIGDALHDCRSTLLACTAIERMTLLAVGVTIAIVLFVGALAPVTDWDSQMYHLQIPKLVLEEGRLHLPADGSHLAFLGLFQFLYLPLLAIDAASGPSVLNAAMTATIAVTLFVAGRRLFSTGSGIFASIAIWGSSSLLIVGVTPRVDVAVTAALAVTHWAVLRAFDDDAAWALPVAAFAGGITAAMKYHALPYLAALLPFAAWALWRRSGVSNRERAKIATTALALAVAAIAPWLAKNVAFFGAPLFPFGAEPRLVPFLAEITGSWAIPADIPAEALGAVGRAREPISLSALLFRPGALTVEWEALSYTRNPLFALLPFALFFLRDRRMVALALPGLAYLAFTLGAFRHTNLRYIIPALPMLALCATEVLQRLAARIPNPRLVTTVLPLVAALCAIPALRVAMVHVASIPRAQVALGLWKPETLLMQEEPYRMARFADEVTPKDAKILMLFEARGFYFDRAVLQDNLLTNWTILHRVGATESCLAGTGITHVLLNEVLPSYYASRGASLGAMSWDRFPEFAQRCLEPLGAFRGEVLFRLRPAAAP